VRSSGFAHRNGFGASIARWLLVIAAGSAATACGGNKPNDIAGQAANVPPGQMSRLDKAQSGNLLHAGDTARERGDLDAAAANYAAAAAADPTSIEAELRLGSVELARKDESGAHHAYQAAQRLAPKNPEAAFRLGEIALTQGAAKAASDQFTIALESRRDDPKLYNAMGVALALQGQYERAKENYEKGLALTPDYPSLRNNYGLMQLARGDLQGALATFSALIASPGANDRYRLNRALVELALGQTAAALADAPGIDEPGLRQTLAIYWTPLRQNVSAPSGSSGAAPAIGAGDKSPLPSVHLAPDPAAVAMAAPTASLEPVAVLAPAASR